MVAQEMKVGPVGEVEAGTWRRGHDSLQTLNLVV